MVSWIYREFGFSVDHLDEIPLSDLKKSFIKTVVFVQNKNDTLPRYNIQSDIGDVNTLQERQTLSANEISENMKLKDLVQNAKLKQKIVLHYSEPTEEKPGELESIEILKYSTSDSNV